MTTNPGSLKSRKLSADETKNAANKAVKRALKAANSTWLAEQFIDQETGQPIQVGEAIAIGEWDNPNDAKNWVSRHLPDAIKQLNEKYDWGQSTTKNGKRISTTTYEPHPIDGTDKWEMWIFRTKQ